MAKRWTETNKWKDRWYMSLTPIQKLIWEYLRDNCDNAGFFEINSRIDAFMIGISEQDYLGAYEGLMRGYIKSKDSSKIWLKKFLFHQKNLPLNPANNAHKQIIGIITENLKNFDHDFNYLGAYEGLFSPIGNNKGKGNDKDKGVIGGFNPEDLMAYFLESKAWEEQTCISLKITPERFHSAQNEFIALKKASTEIWANRKEAVGNFINWLNIKLKKNGNRIDTQALNLPEGSQPIYKKD